MSASLRTKLTIGVVAVAFAVVPSILTRVAPGLLDEDLAGVLVYAAVFAAMALSLNLLTGYAGQISLGHGALVGLGAYATALITGRYYLPMGLGLVIGALMGGTFAFLIGIPALRLRGLYLAITTIAFQAMAENFLFKMPWLARGSGGLEIPAPYAGSFDWNRNGDYLGLVLVIVLGIWLLDRNVTRSKVGRALFAIREDEQVAQSYGVDVTRYKLLAFTVSGAIAGIAGVLYAHRVHVIDSDTFSFEKISIPLLMMVVIGGLGSRVGVVVAAVAFSIMPRLLEGLEGWDYLVGAALLIFAMVRHPGGVAQAIRDSRERKEVKRVRASQAEEDAETAAALPQLPDLPKPASLAPRPELSPGAAMLEVESLTVRFSGLVAVDEASIRVPAGTIVGLIGPNGAGKSTLFNAVGGFVSPASGVVRFMGREIQDLAPHERAGLGIGRTFQHTGLARNLTVIENLLLAQHIAAGYGVLPALAFLPGAARAEAELLQRSHEVVDALGFQDKADTPVRNLSGGQQRIVELACALTTAPDLVMLDEPSAGMAPAAVENLAVRLRDLRDELGRTVLLIEHHIPLVLDVCDEVYVLDAGRVIAHGTPADVAALPEVIDAYLGGPSEPAPAPAPLAAKRTRRVREVV